MFGFVILLNGMIIMLIYDNKYIKFSKLFPNTCNICIHWVELVSNLFPKNARQSGWEQVKVENFLSCKDKDKVLSNESVKTYVINKKSLLSFNTSSYIIYLFVLYLIKHITKNWP